MVTVKSTAPQIELDWEEGLFKWVRGLVRRLKRQDPGPQPSAAPLEPIRRRLEILACLVAGHSMRLVLSDEVRGLRGDDILLPEYEDRLPSLEENAELVLLQTLVLAAWRRQEPASHAAIEGRTVFSLLGLAEAVRSLTSEFSGFATRWTIIVEQVLQTRPQLDTLKARSRCIEAWQRRVLLQQELPSEAQLRNLLPSGKDEAPPMPLLGTLLDAPGKADGAGDSDAQPSSGTERDAPKKIQDVRRKLLDEDEDRKNPIVHTFEKVETLDAHEGGARIADGSDELDDQLEALAEVDLKEVIRGGEAAQSILRADLDIEGEIPDVERIHPGETGLSYDEWDYRRRAYCPDWCTVYPTAVLKRDPQYARSALSAYRKQIDSLYKKLSVHRSRLKNERRQLDGEDIDIDAAIDAAVERAAGREGSLKIYQRRIQQERDLAAAVLVDVSLSTDSWVHNRRVLDVAKHSVLVLGEVAERLGDQLAVYAFASKTRNACRVFEVADFHTPWATAKARLGALEPQGYTRIGPAIRHVSAQLAKQPAKRRLLLVITDGKPSDYDKYEGRHGTADIRMSLREANRDGIVAHALTIDRTARGHLSRTFGPGAWHLMTDPARLPQVLTEVYGRLSE